MSYDTLMAVQVIDDIDRLPTYDPGLIIHIYPIPPGEVIPEGTLALCGRPRRNGSTISKSMDWKPERPCQECEGANR
jgi:hypothetical protein